MLKTYFAGVATMAGLGARTAYRITARAIERKQLYVPFVFAPYNEQKWAESMMKRTAAKYGAVYGAALGIAWPITAPWYAANSQRIAARATEHLIIADHAAGLEAFRELCEADPDYARLVRRYIDDKHGGGSTNDDM